MKRAVRSYQTEKSTIWVGFKVSEKLKDKHGTHLLHNGIIEVMEEVNSKHHKILEY